MLFWGVDWVRDAFFCEDTSFCGEVAVCDASDGFGQESELTAPDFPVASLSGRNSYFSFVLSIHSNSPSSYLQITRITQNALHSPLFIQLIHHTARVPLIILFVTRNTNHHGRPKHSNSLSFCLYSAFHFLWFCIRFDAFQGSGIHGRGRYISQQLRKRTTLTLWRRFGLLIL